MGTHKILYIEDYALNVALLKKMLKFLDYTVMAASTGKEGLGMALREKPDLILMDVMLPDIDGIQLTALFQTYEALRPIPIVAFTADSSILTQKRCLEAGCAAYLTKPLSKGSLFKVLTQLLHTPPPERPEAESTF